MPAVDLRVPVRFLEVAFGREDWIAVFLKSYETGETAQRVGPRSMVTDSRFQAWLRWRNKERWNVYVGVNAVAANQRSRRREAVVAVRHVMLDADRDGDAVLGTIAGRRDVPAPSYVLHTSPGRVHVLWKVTGFATDTVEALQRQLAGELGTDPAATPCSQTTRLPGFFRHKGRPPNLVTVEYRDVEHTFSPPDFPTPATPAPTQAPTVRRQVAVERGNAPRVTPGAVERAQQYLAAVPPAVSGQHGDLSTFRVCCRLARGFALPDDAALAALTDWNARCAPPWSERELRDKLRRARRYGREAVGGLLDTAARRGTDPRRSLEG